MDFKVNWTHSCRHLFWPKIGRFLSFLDFRWNFYVCCWKRLKKFMNLYPKSEFISHYCPIFLQWALVQYTIYINIKRTYNVHTYYLIFDFCRLRHSRLWSPFKFSAILLYILLMVLLILHILKKMPISSDEKLVDNNALGMYYIYFYIMHILSIVTLSK